jgi:hypothetical protein
MVRDLSSLPRANWIGSGIEGNISYFFFIIQSYTGENDVGPTLRLESKAIGMLIAFIETLRIGFFCG